MAQHYSQTIHVESLSDAQLLALFLRAHKQTSSDEQAQALLTHAGSLRALVNQVAEEPTDQHYLSASAQLKLQAGAEIGRRMAYERINNADALTNPQQVREFLTLQLAGLEHEQFGALFLDNRHRVLGFRTLSIGTIDSAAVYPREVVKHCLCVNSAAVIFCHNHPSGVAEPSDTDVRLTRKLIDALALIDVRVLDHIIIGKSQQTSLAERGLM